MLPVFLGEFGFKLCFFLDLIQVFGFACRFCCSFLLETAPRCGLFYSINLCCIFVHERCVFGLESQSIQCICVVFSCMNVCYVFLHESQSIQCFGVAFSCMNVLLRIRA